MKKILVALCCIISIISSALIGWYAWVMFEAPEKIVSQTYKVGEQVVFKTDGSVDKKHFIDVNVYDNVFEIQFNYMLDESKTDFYSQGIQYVLKDNKKTFDFDGVYTEKIYESDFKKEKSDYSEGWFSYTYYWHYYNIFADKSFENIEQYDYMSGNDYETTMFSTNPVDENTMFKIQLGDELYGMKFRYDNIDFEDEFKIREKTTWTHNDVYFVKTDYNYRVDHDFKVCDVDYFAELLYGAISESIAPGTSQTCVFEFGDLFDYYKYDESKKQYSENKLKDETLAKIKADVKSYYCIGVNVHDGEMTSSSQSLFNCFKGNSNFNIENSFDNYFIGRTLVEIDVNKFDFVESETSGSYYLSLNKDFKEFYKDYKHLIEFDVVIDLDYLSSLNIEFLGLIEDSFEDFKIFNSETIKIIDGELIKGVVNYV